MLTLIIAALLAVHNAQAAVLAPRQTATQSDVIIVANASSLSPSTSYAEALSTVNPATISYASNFQQSGTASVATVSFASGIASTGASNSSAPPSRTTAISAPEPSAPAYRCPVGFTLDYAE